MIRRLGLALLRMVQDVQPGDFVRRVGCRGVGIVESIDRGFAVVAWNKDRRDILPVGLLRRTKAGGHNLDSMGE